MNSNYYIGVDVHNNNIEMAIRYKGQIRQRFSLPTSISAVITAIDSIKGKKMLAIEEGPMAGWLYRNLLKKVDKFIVAEPRRNKLISSDGDHDDKIDSAKLALLLEGGFLKEVYHSDDDKNAQFKQWVNLYHDRVKDAVRSINKIRACCRMQGIKIPRSVIRKPENRAKWLNQIAQSSLSDQLNMLFIGYDAAAQQTHLAKKQLIRLGRSYPIIKIWQQLVGVGLIRATTLFAYLDTPFRFRKKSKLWKYCGIGLMRTTSGIDNKGRPKPARLQLPWNCNRVLKNVVLGASISAIRQKNNSFRDDYERMIKNGIITSNARHTVARKMLTVMWGMWKSSYQFDTVRFCQSKITVD
jgi:transposase